MEERKWDSLGHLILIFPVFITAGKRKPAGFCILDFLDKCLMNFHKYSTYKKILSHFKNKWKDNDNNPPPNIKWGQS